MGLGLGLGFGFGFGLGALRKTRAHSASALICSGDVSRSGDFSRGGSGTDHPPAPSFFSCFIIAWVPRYVYSGRGSLVRLGPSCPVFLARTPLRRLVSVACTYGTAAARRTCQHRSSRTCPLLTQSAQMALPSSSSAAGGGVQAPCSPVGEALLDGLR